MISNAQRIKNLVEDIARDREILVGAKKDRDMPWVRMLTHRIKLSEALLELRQAACGSALTNESPAA